MAEQQATRDWHTRAIVRVKETTRVGSVDPWREHTFVVGDELEMVQFGNAGRPVDRSAWWDSYDIDGAFIIKASKVEVVRIIEEVSPTESEDEPMADLTQDIEQACRVAQDQAAHDIAYVIVGEARPFQYHYQSDRLYVEVDLAHHDPDQGAAVALYRVWRLPDGHLAAFKVDIRESED